MGWEVPSSGEAALYATVCSAAALDEFCTLLLSARFGSADVLLDIVGRVNLDSYINDEHIRTRRNPSDQGDSGTCYAHAIAAVLHMALSRVVGRQGGTPTIETIRGRILESFPETDDGWSTEEVLGKITRENWYPPIRQYCKIDEDGARQAVLHRRPVLATFALSKLGWNAFGQHFDEEETAESVLTNGDMSQYRSGQSDGGHAVVLTGCDRQSLTFLNSWGKGWGKNGTFSIKNDKVLGIDSQPMSFYDVFWLEDDLTGVERVAYEVYVDQQVRSRAAQFPGLFGFEAICPLCSDRSAVTDFAGNMRRAICPRCRGPFTPEPGHLVF